MRHFLSRFECDANIAEKIESAKSNKIMERLPDEIAKHILRYLNFDDLLAARHVCRLFRILCEGILLTKTTKLMRPNNQWCASCYKKGSNDFRKLPFGELPVEIMHQICNYLSFEKLFDMRILCRCAKPMCDIILRTKIIKSRILPKSYSCLKCFYKKGNMHGRRSGQIG